MLPECRQDTSGTVWNAAGRNLARAYHGPAVAPVGRVMTEIFVKIFGTPSTGCRYLCLRLLLLLREVFEATT
jgi:hypothetical protein